MEDGRAIAMKQNKTNKGPTQCVVERGYSVVIRRSNEGFKVGGCAGCRL
jgi:hypothetical protein